ncbi:uncharacterized protein [Oscarella lobularis]|uniref:uncharacterized protein n=1 Tax=Oscarella lobularis TaxID=121494 RepID=UPI003313F24B
MVKSLRRENETPEERQKRLLADSKRKSAKRREVTANEKQFRNDMEAQRKRRKRQEAALREKSGEMGEERVPFWKEWATQDEFASAHYPRLDTFHKRMEGLTFHTCVSCEESWPTLDVKYSTQMCKQCTTDQGNGWVGLLTSDNNMNPGRVPPPLKDLSVVEEMLIAQIAPMMHIFRLPAGRQFGYRGHVLNLPQNVQSVLTRLPRTKSNLGMVVVRQTRNSGKVNAEEAKEQKEQKEQKDTNEEEDDAVHFSHSVLPSAALNLTERQKLDKFIDSLGNKSADEQVEEKGDSSKENGDQQDHMSWPTYGSNPISEFTTEGYFTQAFPALFPTGAGDFRSPRLRSVTLGEYLKHIMRYKDGRFARHPRFRYFALNTMMRWRALETARVFVKQNPSDAALTVEELREMTKTSEKIPHFANKVVHFGKSLHGTKQYWNMQKKNLFAMMEKLGSPSCFFTLSAADLHWPEFFNLAAHYSPDKTAEELHAEYRDRNETLNSNPMLADWLFTKRATDYLHNIMANVYCFTDYWARIEYQHRGSAHMHGVGWIRDAPDCEEITRRIKDYPEFQLGKDDEPNEERMKEILTEEGQEIVDFADWLVSTMNPSFDEEGKGEMPQTKKGNHPCHEKWADISDHDADYKRLIATVERHTECKQTTCLKTNLIGESVCRFGFPKTLRKETTLEISPFGKPEQHTEAEIEHKRNDPRVNSHNRFQLEGWRANVDMQVIVSPYAVGKYIAKYATKSEPQSATLKETFKMITETMSTADPARNVVSKLLMKTVGERDYSAQETCHLIMGEKLVTSTREFKTLFLENKREVDPAAKPGRTATLPTVIEEYMRRPVEIEDVCLLDYVSDYYINAKGKTVRRHKSVVVRVAPRILCNKSNKEQYEKYCYYQLMKFKPFRKLDHLTIEEEEAENEITDTDGETIPLPSTKAFKKFIRTASMKLVNRIELMEDIESIVNIQMPFEETEEDPNKAQKDEEKDLGQKKIRDQDDWMKLCRPPNSADDFDEDDTRDSEFNQGDLAHYNWSEKLAQFPPLSEAPKFVTEARKKSTSSKKDLVAAADSSLLQGNQKLAYDIVRSHNELTKSGFECKPLRMIVCGSAGTGKSYLINCIKEMLGSECILAAPTGVAAFNIGGQTLHSLLRIPLQKTSFSDVQGPSLRDLQERFEDVRYLIIDEMSMVGRHQLSLIHRRLCQALPQGACESFGGISLIFFGDMGQLPPVGDSPLYRSAATEGSATNQGRQLYMTFDVVVQLTKIIRQSGNDELQIKFRDALQRLRDGCPSYEDWNDLYMSRNFARHDQLGDVKTSFRDAVRLFACRENVAEFNFNCLKNSNKPVAVINADHNCTEAKNANEEDAGELYARVRLCEGARVMLTSNLWTEMGLVNGSMGYVVAILYQPGAKPPALPTAVVVQMDKYNGPTWGGERCVPICPIERTWPSSTGNRKSSCKRRQLPIQLAWAVTVHKSQGLTLDRAVIDIGKREFAPGITYVGFSRVRHINHCLIQGFDYARISNLSKSKSYKQRLNEDKRLDGLARRTEKTFQSLAGNSNDTVPDDIKEFFKHLENEESVIDKEEHSDHTYSKKMIADNDKDTDKIDTGAVKVTKTAAKKAPVPKPKGKRASRARTSVPLPPAAKKRRTTTPPSPNPFLLQMGRKRESIVGDGNCYFRTVSKAAFGTEDHHLALRLQIVNFMAEYQSVFEMFCCNTEHEAHISKLRQEGAWATQAEIHATATLFQIDVSIFTWMGKEWTWNTYKPRFDITVPALIRLPVNRIEIQHYRNHFDLIVPIDQSELALASPRKSAKACDNPKLLCSSLAANEADLLMANEQ